MSKIFWTDDEIKDIINLYKNKNTIISISEKYGKSETAINNLLRKQNINIANHLDNQKFIENNKIDIINMYNNGISSIKIGEKYNVTYEIILRSLRKWNIEIKTGTNDYKIYSCTEDIFENINSHEKAYWLGFIVGDGSVLDKRNLLKIDLAKVDEDHIIKFKKFMNATNPIYYWTQTNKSGSITTHACISISSSKLKNDLINLKCGPRKSLKEELPPINPIYYNSFILGLVDADGSWFINKVNKKPMLSFFLGSSLSIIKDIKNIFDIEVGYCSNKIIVVEYGPGSMGRITHASKDYTLKLYEYLYRDSPVFLDRKRKLIEDHLYKNF